MMYYWNAVRNEFVNRYAREYQFFYTTMRYYPEKEESTKVEKSKRNSYPFNEDGTLYLTQREADCIYYLIQGLTIKQTAVELLLSPRTVEFYLKRIKEKFGGKNKKELLAFIKESPFFDTFHASMHEELEG